MNKIYRVYQTDADGVSELLYETPNKEAAENEVDRINSNLAKAGVPGWVSSAYYE